MSTFDNISVTMDDTNDRIAHVLLDNEEQHNTLDLQMV